MATGQSADKAKEEAARLEAERLAVIKNTNDGIKAAAKERRKRMSPEQFARYCESNGITEEFLNSK